MVTPTLTLAEFLAARLDEREAKARAGFPRLRLCGEESPEFDSDNARKRWHREHQQEVTGK